MLGPFYNDDTIFFQIRLSFLDVYGIEDVTLRGCKNLPPGVEDGDCKFEQREEEIIVKSSDLTTTFDFSKKYGESCYCTTDKCNTGTVFVTTTTTTTVSTSSPPVISTSTVNSVSNYLDDDVLKKSLSPFLGEKLL